MTSVFSYVIVVIIIIYVVINIFGILMFISGGEHNWSATSLVSKDNRSRPELEFRDTAVTLVSWKNRIVRNATNLQAYFGGRC
jgi:hypothetical protein